MTDVRPIRTPWIQHWRRVQLQLLPVAFFAGCLVLTVWLWGQQAGLVNSVGEAEVTTLSLTSPADGMLVATGNTWRPFDAVAKDQVLIRLDDGPALAALATVRKEIERLQLDLTAEQARLNHEQALYAQERIGIQNDLLLQLRRLELDIERMRLEAMDRQALVDADALELDRQNERYEATKKLTELKIETESRLWDVTLQRDVVKQRKNGNERAMKEAKGQLEAAQQRQAQLQKELQLPTTLPSAPEAFLAPLRVAVAVEESRLNELQIQMQQLVYRAPFDGMIREILRQPGQAVRMGEQIMVLLANESPYVVAYVREYHRVDPRVGMPVDMRLRTLPVRTVQGHISQVGPQVVRVPVQHVQDPKMPEWGLPVRIDFPSGSGIRAGELVDITFRRNVNGQQ